MVKGIVFALTFLAVSARADDSSIFQDWQVGGNGCDETNVHVLRSYDTVALLFDAFSVQLQSKQDKDLVVQRRCNFKIEVLPPAGFYLAGFTQLYSGGIVKTGGTEVKLDIAYKVASVQNQQTIEWKMGQKIRPEDPESSFSRTYTDLASKLACRERFQYHIRMDLMVHRRGKAQGVAVGLDTIDTRAGSEVSMIAQWKPCPVKKTR